jgi:hypothetical protein
MHPHEQDATSLTTEIGVLGDEFTPDEVAQLTALRQYAATHPDHLEADAAIRRLEFARWLVQHGVLTDS